jgi:hypothetical protein
LDTLVVYSPAAHLDRLCALGQLIASTKMNWRIYLVLAFLGVSLSLIIAQFQAFPGYLDSDYYYGGGVQLAQGKGFSEPYLWNYLDDPQGLPHPSHTYWMPLSSIIAAAGMWLSRDASYPAGRLGFILLAGLVPVVTAALAYDFSMRRELALISGLLAVFSMYYAPFLPVSDNYGPYLVLGGLYFLTLGSRNNYSCFILGLLAGLLMLARSDGLMWLMLTLLLIIWRFTPDRKLRKTSIDLILALGGFLLIMGPWFWRMYAIYGTPLAPGSGHLLWLKSYNETFIFPASQLTMQSWVSQGLNNIILARLTALRWNLLNTFAAQGGIFLLPFILIGIWKYRKDVRIRLGILAWLGLLFVMTVIFPYAGSRGGFFHSGAALQSLWWTLAPLGLEIVVVAVRRRNLFTPGAFKIFGGALVGIAVLMTAVIISIRVLHNWGEGEQSYPAIEAYLQQSGIQPGDIVMNRNPPGYYVMTGQPAIVVPYGDETSIFEAAARYGAKFLILEEAGAAGPIKSLYESKQSQHFRYMSEIDGARIFEVQP